MAGFTMAMGHPPLPLHCTGNTTGIPDGKCIADTRTSELYLRLLNRSKTPFADRSADWRLQFIPAVKFSHICTHCHCLNRLQVICSVKSFLINLALSAWLFKTGPNIANLSGPSNSTNMESRSNCPNYP